MQNWKLSEYWQPGMRLMVWFSVPSVLTAFMKAALRVLAGSVPWLLGGATMAGRFWILRAPQVPYF